MNSILNSTKKLLGIAEDYDAFDMDIKTHINMSFSVLTQMGIGKVGFRIEDKSNEWHEFTEDEYLIHFVKDYIYLKVRLIFDPPASSITSEAIKEQLKELEARIMMSEIIKETNNVAIQ